MALHNQKHPVLGFVMGAILGLLATPEPVTAGLFTETPIFAEPNSKTSETSASYLMFRKIWVKTIGGRYRDEAFRLGKDARMVDHAGLTILQIEHFGDYEFKAVTYADRGAPLVCSVEDKWSIEADAQYYDVAYKKRKFGGADDLVLTGEKEALMGYILSVFAEMNLTCELWRTMN